MMMTMMMKKGLQSGMHTCQETSFMVESGLTFKGRTLKSTHRIYLSSLMKI